MKKSLLIYMLLCFFITQISWTAPLYGQDLILPAHGATINLNVNHDLPILRGMKIHPDNAFLFDFILDDGNNKLTANQLKNESLRLIKYFLTSLTIPEKDLWVNLSPYEKDRIIPNRFGLTEMGRDLLAEDYLLKQFSASLIYPENKIGQAFWKRVYEESAKRYGTTNIPINTFNKVWIVPDTAIVYENAQSRIVYVKESKLKVLLEEDYLSLQKHPSTSTLIQKGDTNTLGAQIMRKIVIPALTKEVNDSQSFAQLRQVYNSLILADWYKIRIKDSILSQIYSDKNKIAGIRNSDPKDKERIYRQYLTVFKKGVYNYIKEDIDPIKRTTIPRKYFLGGELFNNNAMKPALNIEEVGRLPLLKTLKKRFVHLHTLATEITTMVKELLQIDGLTDVLMQMGLKKDPLLKTKDFIQNTFHEQWPEALALLGKVLIDENRWPLINRMIHANLPLGLMNGILNIPYVPFEQFPSDFQELILSHSGSRKGFTTQEIEKAWVIFRQVYPQYNNYPGLEKFDRSFIGDTQKLMAAYEEHRKKNPHKVSNDEVIARTIKGLRNADRVSTYTKLYTDGQVNVLDLKRPLSGPLKKEQLYFAEETNHGAFDSYFIMALKDKAIEKRLLQDEPSIVPEVKFDNNVELGFIYYQTFPKYLRVLAVQNRLRLNATSSPEIKDQLGPLEDQMLEAFSLRISDHSRPEIRFYLVDLYKIGHPLTRERINRLFFKNGYQLHYANREFYWSLDKTKNNAMSQGKRSPSALSKSVGGIDLTLTSKNHQAKTERWQINSRIDPIAFDQLRESRGLAPLIINLKPLTNPEMFIRPSKE